MTSDRIKRYFKEVYVKKATFSVSGPQEVPNANFATICHIIDVIVSMIEYLPVSMIESDKVSDLE